jgi:hypothetical protein
MRPGSGGLPFEWLDGDGNEDAIDAASRRLTEVAARLPVREAAVAFGISASRP